MKLSKMLLIVLVLSFLVIPQLSYAGTFAVNLRGDAAGTVEGQRDAAKAVTDAAAAEKPRTPGEGENLGSNTTLTTQMIDEIKANLNVKVTLNGRSVTDAVTGVTDPVGYAIGLGSVRLAMVMVGATGDTYNFTDSTISPLLFSEGYATGQTQGFADAVSNLQANEIAIVIAITMSSDDIKKAIADKVNLDKVVIVGATTADSKEAFTELFKQHNEGFGLRALDRNSPVVVKALQGTV